VTSAKTPSPREGKGADEEVLPFDVETEHLPWWAHVVSAIVIAVGVLVAARVVPMLAFLPLLVLSSINRRFTSSALRVEVDETSLALGDRRVSRGDVLDVWLVDDELEPRVTLAAASGGGAATVSVLHFQNREQARRFAGAVGAGSAVVAGHAPRPVDALSSLRFAAIALAFFATGSWFGALPLAFFALGARALLRAKQVVARTSGFEIRSAFGVRAYAYADVESVDVEAGVIVLEGGREIDVPRAAIRDATLATPSWLEQARARVLEPIARSRGGMTSSPTKTDTTSAKRGAARS
jgi:hypothetical protein